MDFRFPAFNRHGTIDCEINHPVHGWIMTTVTPEDGTEIYFKALAEGPTKFVPPPLPTPEEARANLPDLTPRQFLLAAYDIGVTEDMIAALIGADEIARIEWKHATSIKRSHPLVALLSFKMDLPPEQVDAMWVYAASTP